MNTPLRSVAEHLYPCRTDPCSLLLRVSLALPWCFIPIRAPSSVLLDAADHALLVGGFSLQGPWSPSSSLSHAYPGCWASRMPLAPESVVTLALLRDLSERYPAHWSISVTFRPGFSVECCTASPYVPVAEHSAGIREEDGPLLQHQLRALASPSFHMICSLRSTTSRIYIFQRRRSSCCSFQACIRSILPSRRCEDLSLCSPSLVQHLYLITPKLYTPREDLSSQPTTSFGVIKTGTLSLTMALNGMVLIIFSLQSTMHQQRWLNKAIDTYSPPPTSVETTSWSLEAILALAALLLTLILSGLGLALKYRTCLPRLRYSQMSLFAGGTHLKSH